MRKVSEMFVVTLLTLLGHTHICDIIYGCCACVLCNLRVSCANIKAFYIQLFVPLSRINVPALAFSLSLLIKTQDTHTDPRSLMFPLARSVACCT
jgi:hypothetical protein